MCNTPFRKSVQYQVSHYSILEAKVGNDKFPGFMFENKGTTAALFPVSTSFRILAITFSFLIRFE